MKNVNGGVTELPGVKLPCMSTMMRGLDWKMRSVRFSSHHVMRLPDLALKNFPCWDMKFLCCCVEGMRVHLCRRMSDTKPLDYDMQGKMKVPDECMWRQQQQQHTDQNVGHYCSHQHYCFRYPGQHVPAAQPQRLVRVGVAVRVEEGAFQPVKSCH